MIFLCDFFEGMLVYSPKRAQYHPRRKSRKKLLNYIFLSNLYSVLEGRPNGALI